MPVTLRELLERLRPVGVPGASLDASNERRQNQRAAEVAQLLRDIEAIERDANAIVAHEREHASEIVKRGEAQARAIRSESSQRCAVAEASAADAATSASAAEIDRIEAETAEALRVLAMRSEASMSSLVELALDRFRAEINAIAEGQP